MKVVPLPPPPPYDRDVLVETLLPVVAGWCRRLGGPGVDVEEATHDILMVLLDRIGDLQPGTRVESLAYGITRRTIANYRRRGWFRRWMPGGLPEIPDRSAPLAEVHRRETTRRIDALLAELPEPQREVLVLCDVEDRSSFEVAALLGVPDGTVRSRLRLARARFRVLAPDFALTPPDGDDR